MSLPKLERHIAFGLIRELPGLLNWNSERLGWKMNFRANMPGPFLQVIAIPQNREVQRPTVTWTFNRSENWFIADEEEMTFLVPGSIVAVWYDNDKKQFSWERRSPLQLVKG